MEDETLSESERLRELERRLWQAADQLRAKSKLRAAECSIPVLGLISLRNADVCFRWAERRLEAKATERNPVTRRTYQAEEVMYMLEEARLGHLRVASRVGRRQCLRGGGIGLGERTNGHMQHRSQVSGVSL